jgi:hypothetical protein
MERMKIMEIRKNDTAYQASILGNFAEEREKLLKESAPDLQKIDCFTTTGGTGSGDISLCARGKGKKILDAVEGALNTLPASSLEMKDYMIPANEGRITHMALTYSLAGDAAANYRESLKVFLAHMPAAKFTILTSNERDTKELRKMVNQWNKEGVVENPERVNIISTNAQFSIWAQDSALVMGDKVIQQDRMWFPGYGDSEMAKEITQANPEVKFQRMEGIFIDGGNQLATKDKIFVGSDAIAFMMKDMRTYPSKYETIKNDLRIRDDDRMSQEELCKLMMDRTFPHQKVVIVGYKGQQPAFHIDMAITPLGKPDPESGKPVMLVGDPSVAIKTLEDLMKKSPAKFASYEKAVHKKIAGSPDHPLKDLVNYLNEDKNLQENFDALAKGFERDGYKVERVPYLGSSSMRNAPWITYNNSVFDGDSIFVPNFGVPELDGPANKVFEKYGYNVVPIDMNAISSMMGAINCITKVIERAYS